MRQGAAQCRDAPAAEPSLKQRDEAWDVLKQVGFSENGTVAIAKRGQIPGYLKSPGLAELSKDPLFKSSCPTGSSIGKRR
jgi:hypothetical protein